MWLKKKTYNDLKARVEKLAKENEELISKYEGKINADLNLKEYKKEVDKKAEETVEAYRKNLDALIEKDFNYAFLQQLINKAQKGVLIEVTLKNGNKLVIRKELEDTQKEKDIYSIL